MRYSIATAIFAVVLCGMIFLVQKFLEKADPSIEKIDMSRVIPYMVMATVLAVIRLLILK